MKERTAFQNEKACYVTTSGSAAISSKRCRIQVPKRPHSLFRPLPFPPLPPRNGTGKASVPSHTGINKVVQWYLSERDFETRSRFSWVHFSLGHTGSASTSTEGRAHLAMEAFKKSHRDPIVTISLPPPAVVLRIPHNNA
jgi:hypothetical protein